MKRGAIFTLILFSLFFLPVVSSVEFQLNEKFKQGETLMARISGNFVTPILKENVVFYRGHVKTPIDFGVSKIDGEYYIYASLIGKPVENYSLSIEGVEYIKGNAVIDDNLVKNFSIINETADFSIKPGFIITNTGFFIEVQNLRDSKIIIDIKTQNGSTSGAGFFYSSSSDLGNIGTFLELKSNNIKKINFELANIGNSLFRILELSTPNLLYEIPIFIYSNGSISTDPKIFGFEKSSLLVEMSLEGNSKRIVYLLNKGEATLENISISVSDSLIPYIDLSITKINKLEVGERQKIELFFSSDSNPGLISGSIRARESDDIIDHLTISLNIIEGYIPPPENKSDDNITSASTCSELNGNICGDGEECTEDTVKAKLSNCCLAECKVTETSSTGKIVGWSIIALIGVFLFWFFKSKYKGANKKVNLLEVAKGKKKF